ncbi:Werner Syndrome-like exonuclease [Mycena sanguinolenta]|uniref:3'-5' exonuclease n=1 Tax=Mycena sanguinolenta TaxID=230812 RepID=A0A8H7CHJ4_9AGAR|nr:Werner Syndrome-like exonuclease [Mycena sanguinolenta]
MDRTPFPRDQRTVYATTEEEADAALSVVKDGAIVGFDTEFSPRRPTVEEGYLAVIGNPQTRRSALLGLQIVEWRTQTPFAVAWDNIGLRLVQIAHEGTVVVLDLMKIRAIPKQLRRILESETITKAGAGVVADVKVVWDDLRINTMHVVDVALMANLVLCETGLCTNGFNALALKVCVEQLLGQEFPKDEQKSDWAQPELTPAQIEYAAIDAAACERLHETLSAAVAAKAKEVFISRSWYTVNSMFGELLRAKPAQDGQELVWRSDDCGWYRGNKFVGYP